MKINLRLRSVIIVVIVCILAGLVFSALFTDWKPVEGFKTAFKPKTEPRSMTGVILTEVRNLYSFHTVEYIYKTVFPFDYLDPALSIESIEAKLRKPEFDRDDLYRFEQEYYEAWVLATNMGFSLSEKDYTFAVITVRVIAGFDLANTLYEGGEAREEWELKQQIRITNETNTAGDQIKSIKLKLPPAVITDIIIEDITGEKYDYPEIEIDPESWKKLSAFIEKRVHSRVIEEGILMQAEENGKGFLTEFLSQAGFSKIEFF